MDERPLVSICCITYNHASYVEDCLDGILNQQTNFKYEIIIHDDASTDGTQNIISKYIDNHSEIFTVIFQKQNQYSKGVRSILAKFCYPLAKGRYVAICEGDDYWTDPLKLQKQVDFLESHPYYTFSCHRFLIFDERTKIWYKDYGHALYHNGKHLDIDIDLFLKHWVTQPLTTVIRKSFLDGYYSFSTKFKYQRDVHLFYYLLSQGKGISLIDVMGVYRWHDGGVSIGASKKEGKKIDYLIYRELYLNTKDQRLLPIYLNSIISYYMEEENDEIRSRLYSEAINISSRVVVIVVVIMKKILNLLKKNKLVPLYYNPPQNGLSNKVQKVCSAIRDKLISLSSYFISG